MADKPKFVIRLGVPQMQAPWNRLAQGRRRRTLNADDNELAERLGKAVAHLSEDPLYPGLQSHEIPPLSKRYGRKVFESYVEHGTGLGRRLFWVYGPGRSEITLIGLEPHPEDDKQGGYDRVHLDALLPSPKPAPPRPGKSDR